MTEATATGKGGHTVQQGLVWHYTTGGNLRLILGDGAIKVTSVLIKRNERPAAWFSANQYWEETAAKVWNQDDGTFVILNMAQTRDRNSTGMLARIGIARGGGLVPWREYQDASGIAEEDYRDLARSAKRMRANPREWYASFEPVARDRWLAVEVMRQYTWEPYAEWASAAMEGAT